MKNRIISLFCAGTAALFMLSGCSAVRQIAAMENPTDQTLEEGTEQPENTEEQEDVQNINEPADETEHTEESQREAQAAWKAAYKSLMRELNSGNFGEDIPFFGYLPGDSEYDQLMEYGYGVDGYYLYDVDKDEVPELIVKFGTCEADYDGRLYTFDGEHAIYVGEFPLGHSGLATCPSQNGVILNYGHMGGAYMQKMTLKNGELEFEELLSETLGDDPDASYTLPGEVIPGADTLSEMKPEDTLPIDIYQTWIQNLEADIEPTTVEDENLEQRYLDTILHNGTVVGITADGYGGDTGTCTMEEYLGPNMVDRYADAGMVVEAYTYIDMNGDGTEECVLRLRGADPEEADDLSGKWVVLSEQDGTMYAYCINYSMSYTLLENGAFRPNDEYGTNNFRILFDKDQCFLYYTGLDEKHAEQEWIDIAVQD
mgnify:CR=1 FL=1